MVGQRGLNESDGLGLIGPQPRDFLDRMILEPGKGRRRIGAEHVFQGLGGVEPAGEQPGNIAIPAHIREPVMHAIARIQEGNPVAIPVADALGDIPRIALRLDEHAFGADFQALGLQRPQGLALHEEHVIGRPARSGMLRHRMTLKGSRIASRIVGHDLPSELFQQGIDAFAARLGFGFRGHLR
jgi:hypothetical protein